uniref:No apical meristem-associated C-terminal domain-containing protein n=1 Tax=Brassica oleracea var. oleracea TaxID=109376 RepID=A0A0D3D9L3_BRAOL
MQNQAKKLALKEMHEENKMLLTNLESISDHTTREFIRSEQERIIKKRTRGQQQPPNAPTFYGQLFSDIEGSGSGLPEY